jgi:hypothetical protein
VRNNSISGNDWIWIATRWSIYHRDGFRCLACDKGRRHKGVVLSLDHVDPEGGNAPGNIVTLCTRCNASKCDRSLRTWRPDLVALVRAQTKIPLDRARGRELAMQHRPSRVAAQQYRTRRDVRAKRAAAAAEAIADFCTDGFAGIL